MLSRSGAEDRPVRLDIWTNGTLSQMCQAQILRCAGPANFVSALYTHVRYTTSDYLPPMSDMQVHPFLNPAVARA